MKLKRSWNWWKDRPPVTIAEAVDCELDGSDYERGEIETLRAGLENAHKMIGALVEALHESRALSDDAVLKLLNGSWEIAP